MKSRFLKITGIIIAFIVLAFSFFETSAPKKEAPEVPTLKAADIKETKKPKLSEQKEEYEVINKNEKTHQPKIDTPKASTTKDEPEDVAAPEENNSFYCTLSIDCKNIYNNIGDFPEEKLSLLPADGYILPVSQIEFNEGESVFDVLKKELINRKIHFEFSTAAYNSAYIEGINNIYEFDCGELSGWLYSVNGVTPQYSCSEYKLKNNDSVSITYSCNLGQDTGRNIYE